MTSHAMFPTAQRWKHHRTFLTLRTVPARQVAVTSQPTRSADAIEQALPAHLRIDWLVESVLIDELGGLRHGLLRLQLVPVAVLVGDLDFRGADGAGDGGADPAQAVRPHVVEGELPGVDVNPYHSF